MTVTYDRDFEPDPDMALQLIQSGNSLSPVINRMSTGRGTFRRYLKTNCCQKAFQST